MGVLCWKCLDTATLARERARATILWERDVGAVHWWDGGVMLVMVVMEWANAVSARRCGGVTEASLLWALATRSLSRQPTINGEVLKRKLE